MGIRLGVNVDHGATLRNARGGIHPDVLALAQLAERSGADRITAHLREDRRHIREEDLRALKLKIDMPLNMEMAAIEEMAEIALDILPHACLLVPEKREELTTEGGLNLIGSHDRLASYVRGLRAKEIKVSLFIDPDIEQVEAAGAIGADSVELHTGAYSDRCALDELDRLRLAAIRASGLGLEVHAGHGINYQSLVEIARLPDLAEVNIGHFIIGEALFDGLPKVIKKMKKLLS